MRNSGTIVAILWTICALFCKSLVPQCEPPAFQTVQLLDYLFPLKRDLVCLLLFWPESFDIEFIVQIGTKVIHPAYREQNIHAELEWGDQ